MELLYLWIEKYKNIEHQGFNFSPRYRFEFVPEFEDDEKDLVGNNIFLLDNDGKRLTKRAAINKQLQNESIAYNNFFSINLESKINAKLPSASHISNITGIIGENGAGKSNLLEFIFNAYNIRYPNFFAVYKNTKDTTSFFYFTNIDEEDSKINRNFITFRKLPIKKSIYQIYYSNLINFHNIHFLTEGRNISTSYFLKDKSMLEFQTENLINNLKLIIHAKDNTSLEIPFKLPSNFSFSISPREVFENQKIYGSLENPIIEDSTKEKLEHLHTIATAQFPKNHKDYTIFLLKLSYLNEMIIKWPKLENIRNGILSINLENTEQDVNIYIESFFEIFEKEKPDVIERFRNFLRSFESVYSAELNLNKSVVKEMHGIIEKAECVLEVNITPIKDFLLAYKKLNTNILSFNWQGLSSGEEAFLNIFSRFYSISESINKSDKTHILILIDEGEIGFHPEWQRNYLKYLIDFFPQIYPDKQIQIILTTHSPFLVSDLPKENIIFLKKGEKGEIIPSDNSDAEGKCIVVDGMKGKKQTFGANVHTLLSDAFFLEGGLIGEFAKVKINEILDFYKQIKDYNFIDNTYYPNIKTYYEMNRVSFWKIQNIIGEEYLSQIIKNHLVEIETILFGTEQVNENTKKLEIEKILEKYGIEEIQKFNQGIMRNDKDKL